MYIHKFIDKYTPQFIAQYLVDNSDTTVAVDFTHPSIRSHKDPYPGYVPLSYEKEFVNRTKKGGYYLAHTAIAENADYRFYLKLLMSICLEHLNHLSDSKFINAQVYSQAGKSDDPERIKIVADSFDGFDRIFDKHYKLDNYSFCFCMILYMLIRVSIRVIEAGRNSEFLTAITAKQFAAATNKAFAQNLPSDSNEESFSNYAISWPTDLEPPINITFYASKLLTLLIKVGDEKSILALMSNSFFTVQDTASLARAIELAISSENQPLLAKLVTMLQGIEPKHPAMALANSHRRKFELYAKSSISVDEISKMSGVDFEFALRNALTKHSNFELVEVTPTSGDYGADLILTTKQGTRIAAQCKRFSSKVNLKAVQEVVAAIKHYGCDIGVVISNNGFLNSAQELAKSNAVELWDGEAVLKIFAGEFNFSDVFSV